MTSSWSLLIQLLDNLWKNPQISIFMKIRPVGAKLFYEDRKTERMKLIVTFRNSANASEECLFHFFCFMFPYANLIREHPLGYIVKLTPYCFANMSLETDIIESTVV